jgi:hypothetical protein
VTWFIVRPCYFISIYIGPFLAGLFHEGNSRLWSDLLWSSLVDARRLMAVCMLVMTCASWQFKCYSCFAEFIAVLCKHVPLFPSILITWISSHHKPCSSHVRTHRPDSYQEFRARQTYVRFAFQLNWEVLGLYRCKHGYHIASGKMKPD